MLCWTDSKAGGPKRSCHAAVAVRNKLYSFGGYCDSGRYNNKGQMDVHVFNTESLCWKKLPPVKPGRGDGHLVAPSRCHGHTAVLIEDTVYIWGGRPYCNMLYAFDVDNHIWLKPRVSGTVPKERCQHSAWVLGKVMFIYGGVTGYYSYTKDIYKLDITTMVWSLINTRGTPPPPTSSCHSATIIGTKMFVFGAHYHYRFIETFSVFDTETNHWLSTPARILRWCHSAFTYNGELYIFCGGNSDVLLNLQAFNDVCGNVWKFSPETFSWKKVKTKGKGPGSMRSMCCCMVGDRIFLFGAYNNPDDLYVLDFSPSLKTLCKLTVIQYGLDQSELPHNIRWELNSADVDKS